VFLTEERREAVRARAVRRLVLHASARVPYYRRLFRRHGIDPRSIRGPADLARVPVTSKEDLLAVPPTDLVAQGVDPDRLFTITTSGSTGQPLTIRRTWAEQKVTVLRAFGSLYREGVRPRDVRVTVSMARHRRGGTRSALRRLFTAMGLGRRLHIDCCLPREEIIHRLRTVVPDHITGYSGALSDIAVGMTGADRAALNPRTIAGGSEVLTPGMRQAIRTAFGTDPFDRYGCHELGLMAWECPAAREMHICRWGGIYEVLSDGRRAEAGETGRMIGTSLYSFAMPFLRYDVGDVVTAGGEACRCGARIPVLARVDGRTIHYFPLPDGDRVHAYEMVRVLLASAPWMLQYQIVQDGPRTLVIRLVPRPDAGKPDCASVQAALQRAVGSRAVVRACLADEIKPDPRTGKFPVFVPVGASPAGQSEP
jgi:phenylacetate-CoA ligase